MKNTIHLLKKEFRQIFRDKAILKMILIMPAMQLLILPFAADYEIKDIKVAIVDFDHSDYSKALINKIDHSGYFKLTGYSNSYDDGIQLIQNDDADILIQIPYGFERNLIREDQSTLSLIANAVNGTKGNLGAAYASGIISQFNQNIREEWLQFPRMNPIPMVNVTYINKYNKLANYQTFMVPGILAILLTMVGGFLAALNIVKEKEIGTIEQLNVSPIKKYEFILGKLIPFWVMGFVILTIGLIISYVIHDITPGLNIWVLYAFVGIYMLAILGFGLLVSNFTQTQQQAMMVAFFFMLIFILLSGLYTPIESMPKWAQYLAYSNPVTYMVDVMRMVLLKGATFADIMPHIKVIAFTGVLLNGLAIWSYRKQA